MAKSLKLRLIILIILFLSAALLGYISFQEDRKGVLKIAFLDVGQGDSIYIVSPSGNQMLVDGGPSKAVLRKLSDVMPFYDRSIDVVLATHPDQDHIGGLPDVLKKFSADIFFEPGVSASTSAYEALENEVIDQEKSGEIKKILARRGMVIDLGGGATVEILFPDRDVSGVETNMASIVVRVVYGENEFLLTGDSPKAIESYLVFQEKLKSSNENLLQSDVLKAGHHGSKTSSALEFVSAVSPKYAVISSGKDNKYGHPNQETLDTLTGFGAQILRTDQSGTIIFESDGTNLKLE